MIWMLEEFARLAPLMVKAAIVAALSMAISVILSRAYVGAQQWVAGRFTQTYGHLIREALDGDESALQMLSKIPRRSRLGIAWMLIDPLIEDRSAARIARSHAIAEATSLFDLADGYLRSWFWWRRALALRALGLTDAKDYTPKLIAALDDPHPDVRAAALDALTDLRDPASLQAIVTRVNDTSLHRGRRGAALKAFGSACEPLLLEWSEADMENRIDYIHAIGICGTERSRPLLRRWTHDARVEVRATAFQAMGYVGLDDITAQVAIDGLESNDVSVRAMAAFALRGWQGPGDASAHLAPHLDDSWPVAVRAARTLRSMGEVGLAELQARAAREGLGGLLARQMLWQPDAAH